MGYRHRARLWVALIILAVVAIAAGIECQRRWDAACAAERPGSRWNADDWLCVPA